MCKTMAYLVGILQQMETVPYVGIGFEDGSILAAVRSSGVIYTKVRDVQNVLGQGIGFRRYNVDATTSTTPLHWSALSDCWFRLL